MASSNNTQWQLTEVKSPNLDQPVPVVAVLNLPYVNNGHRLQTLNIYLPKTFQTNNPVGQPVANLPTYSPADGVLCWQVHIHGGAWRDPELTSTSIEPAAAHAFILSGHSAGACLAFQSTLRSPQAWGLDAAMEPPRPVAVVGINGLYGLPGLVHDLGYRMLASRKSIKDFRTSPLDQTKQSGTLQVRPMSLLMSSNGESSPERYRASS